MSLNRIAQLMTSAESEPFVTAIFGVLLLLVSAGLRRFETPGTGEDLNASPAEDARLGSSHSIRPQFPPPVGANTFHPGR